MQERLKWGKCKNYEKGKAPTEWAVGALEGV